MPPAGYVLRTDIQNLLNRKITKERKRHGKDASRGRDHSAPETTRPEPPRGGIRGRLERHPRHPPPPPRAGRGSDPQVRGRAGRVFPEDRLHKKVKNMTWQTTLNEFARAHPGVIKTIISHFDRSLQPTPGARRKSKAIIPEGFIYTYRGGLLLPNGHAGPWKRLTWLSPMGTALFTNRQGQKDVIPVHHLMWKIKTVSIVNTSRLE